MGDVSGSILILSETGTTTVFCLKEKRGKQSYKSSSESSKTLGTQLL